MNLFISLPDLELTVLNSDEKLYDLLMVDVSTRVWLYCAVWSANAILPGVQLHPLFVR